MQACGPLFRIDVVRPPLRQAEYSILYSSIPPLMYDKGVKHQVVGDAKQPGDDRDCHHPPELEKHDERSRSRRVLSTLISSSPVALFCRAKAQVESFNYNSLLALTHAAVDRVRHQARGAERRANISGPFAHASDPFSADGARPAFHSDPKMRGHRSSCRRLQPF